MDASARPLRALHRSRLLDRPREDARARQVRRDLPRGHRRRVRRVRRRPRARAARIGAGARERSAAARARDGAGHAASRLRRDREPDLRAAVSVRAAHVDARSPDERAHRLERRHRLSGQRRARDGPRAADRSRRPLRTRGRLHGRRLQAVGTELGRRRGDPRRACARVRAAGQGAARDARRAVLFGRRNSSERAVAAAHAGAVPGWFVRARRRVRGPPCGMRVRERTEQGRRARRGARHPRGRRAAGPRSGVDPDLRGRERRDGRDRTARAREVRRIPALREPGSRPRAFRELDRHRLREVRTRRADLVREDGLDPVGRRRDLAQEHDRHVDGAPDARTDVARRALCADRRLAVAGRGRTAGVDRRDGHRRLQRHAHGDAGVVRGFRRLGRARAAEPRRLQGRLRSRADAAREAVRRGAAAAGLAYRRAASAGCGARRRAFGRARRACMNVTERAR
ncbi:Coenzyme F420-dependent N5,N10-methylene tetrahydromethanopterin reductase [Burkholderia dolosa AU0158]|nr:Coenzyme F420-dependent N5,N10-methylene tetrahydromethanopterin reductase [Burkholderia dolosa AU0158]